MACNNNCGCGLFGGNNDWIWIIIAIIVVLCLLGDNNNNCNNGIFGDCNCCD